MFVEKAQICDVETITNIHRECWKDTYTFIPKELHEARSFEVRLKQWTKAIQTDVIGERLFTLKTECGKPVGFTYCRPNVDADIAVQSELHATYILKEYRGGISGPILKLTAMKYLIQANRPSLGFWAFDKNKAVIIHRSWGWKGVIKRNRIINGISLPETGFIHPDQSHLIERLENFIALRSCRTHTE